MPTLQCLPQFSAPEILLARRQPLETFSLTLLGLVTPASLPLSLQPQLKLPQLVQQSQELATAVLSSPASVPEDPNRVSVLSGPTGIACPRLSIGGGDGSNVPALPKCHGSCQESREGGA